MTRREQDAVAAGIRELRDLGESTGVGTTVAVADSIAIAIAKQLRIEKGFDRHRFLLATGTMKDHA